MKSGFGTICTSDYFFKAKTLYDSIAGFDNSKELHVLIIDRKANEINALSDKIHVYDLSSLEGEPYAQEIISKYSNDSNVLRWSLKPVFAAYLLRHTFSSLILLDNDIYFFQPYEFLFQNLTNHRVLLTPHWRSKNPAEDEFVFINNFTDGVFNAGFFAATNSALDILEWWAMVCAYKCEKNYQQGLWDDQKYLDLLPARFNGVGIVWHQGCNVAWWNKHELLRTSTDGHVMINATWPVVFIHFTSDTIKDISHGGDPLLSPFLEQYTIRLEFNKLNTPLHG